MQFTKRALFCSDETDAVYVATFTALLKTTTRNNETTVYTGVCGVCATSTIAVKLNTGNPSI